MIMLAKVQVGVNYINPKLSASRNIVMPQKICIEDQLSSCLMLILEAFALEVANHHRNSFS